MKIKGKYFAGTTAKGIDTEVELCDNGFLIDGVNPGPVLASQVVISSRIGNTPRLIQYPGGAVIETLDNDKLDAWLKSYGTSSGVLHRLESNLRFAIAAVVSVAVIFTWFAIWGIPWLSTRAALAIPAEINNYIGKGTLETLDNRLFKATTLDRARQSQLSNRFNTLKPEDDSAINYRLLFRGGGMIGPNAFALPDGTVVITDELVRLAKDDDEIMSVLLHEIGHVIHRHSLRKVISHTGLLTMTAILTGDVNSAGTLILAMPNVLVDTSYSRELEYEADTYSLEWLPRLDIAPYKFADFMERLVACARFDGGDENDGDEQQLLTYEDCEKFVGEQEAPGIDKDSWIDYIASHPPTINRISRFRDARQSVTISN